MLHGHDEPWASCFTGGLPCFDPPINSIAKFALQKSWEMIPSRCQKISQTSHLYFSILLWLCQRTGEETDKSEDFFQFLCHFQDVVGKMTPQSTTTFPIAPVRWIQSMQEFIGFRMRHLQLQHFFIKQLFRVRSYNLPIQLTVSISESSTFLNVPQQV